MGLALAAARLPAASVAPIVRGIEVRSDAPVDRSEVDRIVALEIGAPLDDVRVGRTLRGLRFSGLASEVAVYSRPVTDGVVAVIAIWAATQVGSVEIEGDLGLKRERLNAVIPFGAGQPLLEDRVLRGLYALKDLYAAEGFRTATVSLDVAVDSASRTARVRFDVAAGPRVRVGQVTFTGSTGKIDDAQLLKLLRAGPGDIARSRDIEANVERLQSFLFESGYGMARVELAQETVADGAAPAAGSADVIDLTYHLVLGPRLQLTLIGAERKELEKNDLLPFLGEGGYDDALVLQAVARIRRYYQEKGFYHVEVERDESRSEDSLELTLAVRPGERFVLDDLAFEGNESFPADRLMKLMSSSPRRALVPGSGRLVDPELGADLSNLRSFYALEGFDHVRVGPARIVEHGNAISVTVPIEEGRRRVVREIRFEGLAPLDERALRSALPLTEGGPFHRLRIEQSVEQIRARLGTLGFGSAIVASETAWDETETAATVTLRALPGRHETVSGVLVRGLDRTRPRILRRFLTLDPGDPLSRAALLETQRRLYSLGIFSQVDVRAPAASGVNDAREVLVEVKEGQARAASFGLGYDSESGARGLLRLSHGNLFGRISSLTLDLLLSQRERHSRLIFRQPYLGAWDAEFQSALYDEHEERPSFVVDRTGGQISLHRRVEPWTASIFASYRIVKLDAGADVNEEIPLDSRNARVMSLTPGIAIDRRDDAIDPRTGWTALGQLEYAFPFADANASFLKLFGQVSGFLPISPRTVLALSLRGGAIEPLATSGSPSVSDLEVSAPAAELFYAGGRTSHRAYERDELGIVGETLDIDTLGSSASPYPLGGGGLLLANIELRFPIAGPVGGTLFADGGNVWRDYRDIDPGEVKWGAGLGVRYLSPVGPLRLEIGWKLDREPFEDPYVWFFSLGNSF